MLGSYPAQAPALYLGKRLLNVVPDVLNILDAAAEAHQAVQDAVLRALLGALHNSQHIIRP